MLKFSFPGAMPLAIILCPVGAIIIIDCAPLVSFGAIIIIDCAPLIVTYVAIVGAVVADKTNCC